MVLNKHQIEQALHLEKQDIAAGRLKEDSPLDTTDDFRALCDACRRGDLKTCQEKISAGVNVNGRDNFDYQPLILASLCGHYEVVRHLLESGALCERDTFQGERCLYNALNDKIKNLLLSYDYSKTIDPLQPLAAHITSLLTRREPITADITLHSYDTAFELHRFILAARSPYFATKLFATPNTKSWKLNQSVPTQSFATAVKYLYMAEVSADLGDGEEEQVILKGIDKISKQLEIERLFENILEGGDRRTARQRRTEEIARARDQIAAWFERNVLGNMMHVDTAKAGDVKWDKDNAIFADVLLQADELQADEDADGDPEDDAALDHQEHLAAPTSIPVGDFSTRSRSASRQRKAQRSVLFPAHRAMLSRSEFFTTMFGSGFREAQDTAHLQIIPIDCSPRVLEIVLAFLYTEASDISLDVAVDVLFAADLLFIDKLKQKAAMIISTLGNGKASIVESDNARGETNVEDAIDIFDVIRAGWDTRVPRLEEFGARYLAHRLERFIDDPEFAAIVRESAGRIQLRQEVDSVELIDDIRYYLSERFRLRFEDAGLDEMMDEDGLDPSSESAPVKGPHEDKGEPADAADEIGQERDTRGVGLELMEGAVVRTLDGDIAGDEFAQDAINYQILLGKIDLLLEQLDLDA